jgi:7,8-dihydropterin-6-yl-methyl-4-(beta-D-ribofuranosyl)aminobenzene 5'-phosphate synthase
VIPVEIKILFENHSGFKKGFLGGHGFSALIEHKNYRILVDTGTDGETLLKNMEALNINPNKIDYLFLTHGHYDHTGGIKALLERRSKSLPIVAHPDIFVKRVALKPHLRNISLPFSKEELEALGAEFILVKEPFQIVENIWSSGEIERKTWSREVGYRVKNGKLIKDDVRDDMALILDLGDVMGVITGCGHSGILNIIMHAQNLLNKPVKALIGGFHLIGSNEKLLKDAIRGLKELGVQKLYAGHCTGFEAIASFMHTFGKNVEPLYVGKVIEF